VGILDRATSRLPRPWRTAVDWVVTLSIAVAAVLVFEAEVAKPYRIPSASMEPTLHCARPSDGCRAGSSDRVVACRICYVVGSPKRGQIVVFDAPAAAARSCTSGGTFVKRLVGLPGETLHEDAAGFIWVDGRRLSEPYVDAAHRAADTGNGGRTWRVPEGSYFMLGDNRGDSCDSRAWGSVSRDALIGPIVSTYWPPRRIAVT
jgi:signal peptidase I